MTNDIEIGHMTLINVQRKPMYHITMNDKPFAAIYAGVANNVNISDEQIKFYKDKDEVILIDKKRLIEIIKDIKLEIK